jgi:hypothetical protein
MIRAYRSSTPFNSPVLTYTKSKEGLSASQLDSLLHVKTLSFQFGEEVYEAEERLFFKMLAKQIMQGYHLALVLAEKMPQPASKSRSYKKLLYPHRQALGAAKLFEAETLLAEGCSILYSAVLLGTENLDYACRHLLDSRLAFGLIFGRDTSLSAALRRTALSELIEKTARPHAPLDLNPLLLIAQTVMPDTALLHRSADGVDRTCLHLFYQDEALGELARGIEGVVKMVAG